MSTRFAFILLMLAALDAQAQSSNIGQAYKAQGLTKPTTPPVTCSTTTQTLIEGRGNRRQWSAVRGPDQTDEVVYICCDQSLPNNPSGAPTATPAPCGTPGPTPSGGAATIVLANDSPSYTEDDAAPVRCRCRTSTGTTDVYVTESAGP